MRILLQHVSTQLYLLNPGVWTANPLEARDFVQAQLAIDFAREQHIDSVQIAVTFADPHFDEVVALPPLHARPQKPPGEGLRPGLS